MSRSVLSTDIRHIMNHFNYQQVHKVMTMMKWPWFYSKTETGIPSVEEMKELSSELLNKVAGMALAGTEGREYMIETGGFRAEGVLEDGDIYLRLTFMVESWDNYDQFIED